MAGLVINTNMMSLNAQRNLRLTQGPLSTTMERLSSGLRINSAKDDAAGLAIATRMTTQIRGLTVSSRNAADGLSMAQTAEGALDEVVQDLQRIRELALQAMSGQYSATDVSFMQLEVNALVSEIDRIGTQTKFNNVKLFDGYFRSRLMVSSAASDAPITLNLSNMAINTNAATPSNPTVLVGTTFGISDTTPAVAAEQGFIVDLSTDLSYTRTGPPPVTTTGKYSLLLGASNFPGVTLPSNRHSNASNTIAVVDGSLQAILQLKSYLGAKSNQFEAAIRNIETVIETTTASKSRIMDADFAKETADLTKSLILQQAGISVLSQANSIPQSVLSLLKG